MKTVPALFSPALAARSSARRLLAAVAPLLMAAAVSLFPQAARATCTSGGCVTMGPRAAQVTSTQGPLLNALLGALTGSNLNVSVLDWNSIAGANVSLLATIAAVQTTTGVSTPQTALNAPITLGQLTAALSTAASSAGQTAASVALQNLGVNLNLPGTITLGGLLSSDGLVGTTSVNALQVATAAVELYNKQNVATTPTPVTISGSSLGLSGVLNSVQLSAQAVEPPVSVCGPVGSGFHSSAIRIKLALNLVSLSPSTSTLGAVLGLVSTSVSIGQLQLYVEVGEASGVISAVNAITNAMTVQATPGLAALYLGTMPDSVFFNRGHQINPATDLGYGSIGALTVGGASISIGAKAAAVGATPFASSLAFSGANQTLTASTGLNFSTTLLTSLVGNLSVSINPSLGLGAVIDNAVLPLLTTIVDGAVAPVLSTVASGLVDPLLQSLGIDLGQVDVTSGGTFLECALSGCVYADPNHNARQDSGELGIGSPLYAKLVTAATPTVASAVATVDPTTGNYAFSVPIQPAGNVGVTDDVALDVLMTTV
jgi:uncharacterized membrane protein